MQRTESFKIPEIVDTLAAWTLAILWVLPLLYAVWTAFHPSEFSAKFTLLAPLTLENFDDIKVDDLVLLIVEDDVHYAKLIMDVAHEHGFKALVATRGLDALALANDYNPTAVSLDVSGHAIEEQP